jgi:hypothetical protein
MSTPTSYSARASQRFPSMKPSYRTEAHIDGRMDERPSPDVGVCGR